MNFSSRSASLGASVVVMSGAVLLAHAQRPAPPSLADVLSRTATYVADYEARFSAIVSEESYHQSMNAAGPFQPRRELKSEMLVLNAGAGGWMGFRDVYEVNGTAVRDHDSRLTTLLVSNAADTIGHARQIADESARYNLGAVRRNINIPTLALSYLRRENQARSTFRLNGTAKVRDVDTVILAFAEQARPTVIRSGEADAPATGRFWIDAPEGRIVRSEIDLKPSRLSARITVNYASEPKLNLWVPVSMTESYSPSNAPQISGSASYSNFRRFDVNVATIIK